jgi:hypothetical protein
VYCAESPSSSTRFRRIQNGDGHFDAPIEARTFPKPEEYHDSKRRQRHTDILHDRPRADDQGRLASRLFRRFVAIAKIATLLAPSGLRWTY